MRTLTVLLVWASWMALSVTSGGCSDTPETPLSPTPSPSGETTTPHQTPSATPPLPTPGVTPTSTPAPTDAPTTPEPSEPPATLEPTPPPQTPTAAPATPTAAPATPTAAPATPTAAPETPTAAPETPTAAPATPTAAPATPTAAPDLDSDGFSPAEGDCDDTDPSRSPDAIELCDGLDNDCNGQVDDDASDATLFYLDEDEDGYGDPEQDALSSCAEEVVGYADSADDCDDADPLSHPDAGEGCDGADNNCDGSIDEGVTSTYYLDADADGYGSSSAVQSCSAPPGYVSNASDCKDSNDGVYPNAAEVCNGIDDDCDTLTDENVTRTFYADADGDGFGNASSTAQGCSTPAGYVANSSDCSDGASSVYPGAPESCNGVDDDCDGQVDDNARTVYYQDVDQDGFGNVNSSTLACSLPSGYVTSGSDCNDNDSAIYPGAAERCNGIDDDCDTLADEGVLSTFYLDADGDGFGNTSRTLQACTAPSGYVSQGGDCNDLDASIYPGATEAANNKDDDCDGSMDEGILFKSCAEVKAASSSAASGSYVLYPAGISSPLTVWCDMSTDGGGWTVLPLDFADTNQWNISVSGTACAAITSKTAGVFQSIHRNVITGAYSYTSLKFVPPVPFKEVRFEALIHSTATTYNNMDLTVDRTPAATGYDSYESWYFSETDPKVPLAYVFGDKIATQNYTCSPGSNPPYCEHAYIDSTSSITKKIALGKTLTGFHMVSVQGCGSSISSSTQAERFYINHPASSGVWKTGIMVR